MTQKLLEPKAEQFAQLQLLNDELDQNVNFAKFPSAKWLCLNKFKCFLQFLSFWLNLFLC